MTCVIPEYCFTPEEDADYYKRGKRCAEKGWRVEAIDDHDPVSDQMLCKSCVSKLDEKE